MGKTFMSESERYSNLPVEFGGAKIVVQENYFLNKIDTKRSITDLKAYIKNVEIAEDEIGNNTDGQAMIRKNKTSSDYAEKIKDLLKKYLDEIQNFKKTNYFDSSTWKRISQTKQKMKVILAKIIKVCGSALLNNRYGNLDAVIKGSYNTIPVPTRIWDDFVDELKKGAEKSLKNIDKVIALNLEVPKIDYPALGIREQKTKVNPRTNKSKLSDTKKKTESSLARYSAPKVKKYSEEIDKLRSNTSGIYDYMKRECALISALLKPFAEEKLKLDRNIILAYCNGRVDLAETLLERDTFKESLTDFSKKEENAGLTFLQSAEKLVTQLKVINKEAETCKKEFDKNAKDLRLNIQKAAQLFYGVEGLKERIPIIKNNAAKKWDRLKDKLTNYNTKYEEFQKSFDNIPANSSAYKNLSEFNTAYQKYLQDLQSYYSTIQKKEKEFDKICAAEDKKSNKTKELNDGITKLESLIKEMKNNETKKFDTLNDRVEYRCKPKFEKFDKLASCDQESYNPPEVPKEYKSPSELNAALEKRLKYIQSYYSTLQKKEKELSALYDKETSEASKKEKIENDIKQLEFSLLNYEKETENQKFNKLDKDIQGKFKTKHDEFQKLASYNNESYKPPNILFDDQYKSSSELNAALKNQLKYIQSYYDTLVKKEKELSKLYDRETAKKKK